MFARILKKRRSANKQRPIFNLQLDLTYHCNLSCKHCYQRHSKVEHDKPTMEHWKGILEQYRKLARKIDVSPALTLSGGEPLMYKQLWEVIDYAKAKCDIDRIYLLTNGTLINKNVVNELVRCGAKVQLSIEGPTQIDNDIVRGRGVFKKILSAADLMRSYGVSFTYQTVLRKGMQDSIEELFKLAAEYSASAMNFTRLIPASIDGKYNTSDMLSGAALRRVYEDIIFHSDKFKVPTNTRQPLWCLIDGKIGHPSSAGFLGLTIDPAGGIHVTSRTTQLVGDASDKNGLIDTYLKSKVLRRLRKNDINGCSKCSYFRLCRGDRSVSFVLNGDYFGPDKHCWYWQKEIYDEGKKD